VTIPYNNPERIQYGFLGSQHRIRINTKITLTGATCKIYYIKPNGATGNWTANIDGTYVYYDPASTSIIDQRGKWFLYAHITKGGVVYIGKTVLMIITNPGSNI